MFHAFLDGVSFFLADILDIRLGNTFSGGAIDFTLFGILQGNDQTNWLLVLPIGAVWFALYYFSFRFAIKRFKIGTPGHLEDTIGVAEPETQDKSALVPVTVGGRGESTIEKEAAQILHALGGATNLEEVDACITRLRVSVKDPSKVDKPALRKLGATDVFEVRGGVQAVYGGKAILYKSAINESLGLDD
ncbi:glucose PTS transporter subunit EIIB [Cryobacterium zongtaii]|uniref:glucose PTS transporter subunit EIIB n=1 Tax=Cryobacterium zongtaii TaxID=1259217 RepID=UPI002434D970|nr:glucose PTS transporter subunit EIIB [Cryobacterium zongtaii]